MPNYDLSQFNSFLQKATDAVTCNSECQRSRTMDSLKQKFENAQTNTQSANYQLQVAQKNYVTFSEGEGAYNDLLQQQLEERANLISQQFQENFNKETTQVARQIDTYGGILVNFKNIVDLYFNYKKENIKLFKKLKEQTNDVLTNERKTYYIDQQNDTLTYFYFYFLLIIYVIIVICYLLFSLMYPSNASIIKRILIFIGLILLPFLSYFILAAVIYIGYKIFGLIPKNIYRQD
jgi:ABC-type transport system involved in cytochrome bd biosynthesis fused ATPase/permease subunit